MGEIPIHHPFPIIYYDLVFPSFFSNINGRHGNIWPNWGHLNVEELMDWESGAHHTQVAFEEGFFGHGTYGIIESMGPGRAGQGIYPQVISSYIILYHILDL